jgi:hypothetical protein
LNEHKFRMRDDSEVQTYCDNILQLLLGVPKEIISEADNRVFDAIRQNAIDVNELESMSMCFVKAAKKINQELLSNYYQSSAIFAFFSPSSSYIFSVFRIFCFRSMMLATKIKRKDKR